MGLFDRKSKNQINDLIERGYRYGSAWFTPLDRWDLRKYSDEYLWLILETIFAGMRNVRFYSDVDDRKLERIVAFLDTNFIPMIWEMWHTGAIVVGIGDKGKPYMVDWSDVRKGRDSSVARRCVRARNRASGCLLPRCRTCPGAMSCRYRSNRQANDNFPSKIESEAWAIGFRLPAQCLLPLPLRLRRRVSCAARGVLV